MTVNYKNSSGAIFGFLYCITYIYMGMSGPSYLIRMDKAARIHHKARCENDGNFIIFKCSTWVCMHNMWPGAEVGALPQTWLVLTLDAPHRVCT